MSTQKVTKNYEVRNVKSIILLFIEIIRKRKMYLNYRKNKRFCSKIGCTENSY
jgi:hypothetical protein